jgi:hypothetical protein
MIFALRVNRLSGKNWRGPSLRTTPANPQDRFDRCIEYHQPKAATLGREGQQAFTAVNEV